MKIPRVVFVLLLMAAGPAIITAASDEVSALIANVPVTDILNLYERFAGQKVAASSEIKAMKVSVGARIQNKTKAEARRILEDALAKQAGVEIVHEQDGSFSARKIVPQK